MNRRQAWVTYLKVDFLDNIYIRIRTKIKGFTKREHFRKAFYCEIYALNWLSKNCTVSNIFVLLAPFTKIVSPLLTIPFRNKCN